MSDMEQAKHMLLEELHAVYPDGEGAVVAWVVAKTEGLERHIQRLEEQLAKNSQNSGKPPSSDGLKKPSPKSQRRVSGNRRGGQDAVLAFTHDFRSKTLPLENARCPKTAVSAASHSSLARVPTSAAPPFASDSLPFSSPHSSSVLRLPPANCSSSAGGRGRRLSALPLVLGLCIYPER